jgi:transaldolase
VQLFLDSGDETHIRRWSATGAIDGVTTNPTILLAQGWRDLREGVQRVTRAAAPRPVSVEVYASEPADMLEQAHRFASWADNVVVKIPVLAPDGRHLLDVVHTLEGAGVRVNCTACFSFGQGMLAAKAGASYVSLLSGRIDDEGGDGPATVGALCSWLDRWQLPTRVIVGSARCPRDVQAAAVAGAHVVTVAPAVLAKVADHRFSRATSAQFTLDGQAAFATPVPTEMPA